MIKVRQATKEDKEIVLNILDDFRTVCRSIINPEGKEICTEAKRFGSPIFSEVIDTPKNGAVFLAFDDLKCIGAISIYRVPQIRRGVFRAEIEEMYAEPAYHGKGVGTMLMQRAEKWAKDNNISTIQLISNFALKRAHSFYKKMGFIETSKSFEKTV